MTRDDINKIKSGIAEREHTVQVMYRARALYEFYSLLKVLLNCNTFLVSGKVTGSIGYKPSVLARRDVIRGQSIDVFYYDYNATLTVKIK